MTVSFKAPLKSSVTNNAYVSKTADDIKTGKAGLNKPSEGNQIFSTQKSINDMFDAQGTTEGDVNAKIYATNNKISDGDSQKTTIEKFDVAVDANETNLSNHQASVTAHPSSSITYDDTVSGNGQTTVKGAIDDNESRVQAIEDSVNAANGICPLDGSSKVPTANLPDSVLGALQYQGTWDADTNAPAIPVAAVANDGHYYIVSVAGATSIDGITDWEIGDWIVSNATTWEKIDNTDKVSSVNGQTGVAVLDKTSIGLSSVTDDSQLKRSANDFNSFANKVAVHENDRILIEDSEAAGVKKYSSVADVVALAVGGGGGGSFVWELNSDNASPFASSFNGISLFDFDDQSDAEMFALVTVPSSYVAGVQINLNDAKFFSEAAANNVLFKCVTQRLSAALDMSTLPITGHTSTNTELTLTTASALTSVGAIDLTDGVGEINSIAVAIGEVLLIKFYRDNTNETTPAVGDARFLKFSAGVSFV